jgi:hypothetical protein
MFTDFQDKIKEYGIYAAIALIVLIALVFLILGNLK